ncbi:hypothetical protein [Inquilinus sp. OTU3971]|uniref:hypothetical protein n=1 Tax=Inquilinus sp. OTU3971 TaxID=3043855 RepID=UPI00313DA6DD
MLEPDGGQPQPPRLAWTSTPPSALDDEGYRAAIGQCVDAILRMHLGERLVNKIFGRNLQSHAAGLIVVMHHEALLGLGPRPTLRAIQQEMGHARTLAGFVALLRAAGFLAVEPVPHDGRSAYLVPLPPLIDGLRQWLSHHLHCAKTVGLVPQRSVDRLIADEVLYRRFLGLSRGLLARTRRVMTGDGAWAWFDRFDCGDRIALILLHAHHAATTGGRGPRWFDVETRDMAARLGVSHSHVRSVLNRAEVAGLVEQDRRLHRIALTDRFLAESWAWFATFWGWIADLARETEAAGMSELSISSPRNRDIGT